MSQPGAGQPSPGTGSHLELDPDPDLSSRERTWEHLTEVPLIAASVVFLVAYALRVLFEPQLGHAGHDACEAVQWAMWVLFVLDYLVRLVMSPRRGRWFGRHLFDLAVICLPMIRPLRLLRLVALLRVVNRRATVGLRGRVVSYLAGGSLLLWFVASLAVLDAERLAPGANIHTFDEAMWWALATMTTVGYGDLFPVTNTGRAVAACLMVSGIALLGTVTATLASWLADRVRDDDATMDEVLVELRALRREVADLRGGQDGSASE